MDLSKCTFIAFKLYPLGGYHNNPLEEEEYGNNSNHANLSFWDVFKLWLRELDRKMQGGDEKGIQDCTVYLF